MNIESGCLLVGWDFSNDNEVLIVGQQVNGKTDILNAFSGEEAREIFNMLITQKKKEDDQK